MDKTPKTSTQKPEAELKVGAVAATIWKNEGPTGPYYTITVSRFYKDPQTDSWKRTKTLRPKDMPSLVDLSGQVTEKIAELASGQDTTPASDVPPETPKKKAPRKGKAKTA